MLGAAGEGEIGSHFKRRGNIVFSKTENSMSFWVTVFGYFLCFIIFFGTAVYNLSQIL